jgi:hypothetical protein
MQLTHQSLLPYQGFHGTRGLCHIRVYEQPGRLPVVIAGALEDGPGTSTTNAIEMVAAAIQASDPSHYAGTLLLIDGAEIHATEGTPIEGDFRDPSWEPVADIERLLGCEVEVWEPGSYTARAVAGEQGQQLRDEVAEESAEATARLRELIEPDD